MLLQRILGVFRAKAAGRRIAEETEFHLEMLAAKYESQGLSAQEARLAARREFGGVTQMQDRFRDQNGLPWLDALRADMKFAIRSFCRTPGVALLIIVTLGLGIGANTAIFSFLNELLLRPLPYPGADTLVAIGRVWPGELGATGPQDFARIRDKAVSFESVATSFLHHGENVELPRGGAVHAQGLLVSASYFPVLGMNPLLGRTFAHEEDVPNGPKAVVLSHAFWRNAFQGDPSIVGTSIKITGVPHTVAGVMPPDFEANSRAQLWLPLQSSGKGNDNNYTMIARLRPGVTIGQASAEVDALFTQLDRDNGRPDGRRRDSATGAAVPLRELSSSEFRGPVMVLYGGVCLLLFVACLNVANLLLARSAVRAREIAVRASLGAGRARILRQMLTESLLLSLLGGALGVALGYAMIAGLKKAIPYAIFANVTLDRTTLLFTLTISLAVGILFGLAPSIHSSRVALIDTLKDAGKSASSGRGALRGRQLLVFSQVALCMVLLAASGLLVRTVLNLRAVAMGFDPGNLLIAPMALNADKLKRETLMAYYEQSIAKVGAIPGVADVAVTTQLPVEGQFNLPLELPDSTEPERTRSIQFRMQTSGAFRTLGMRILQGRDFQDTDRASGLPVAVVNEAFAAAYFRGKEVLGRRITMRRMGLPDTLTIAGVVNDVREIGLKRPAPPVVYALVDQMPERVIKGVHSFVPAKWVIRVMPGMDSDIAGKVRQAVGSIDPAQPFQQFETMQSIVARTMELESVLTLFLGAFAALTLAMVASGLYGTMAYAVSQRRQEIGIRMALGANWTHVVGLIAATGLAVVAGGIALGAVGSYWATKLLKGFLFDVPELDPVSLAGAAIVLLLVAAAASAGPSLMAARTDPLSALRME